MKVFVFLLCGIPASGKSFFSNQFCQFLTENNISNEIISFDQDFIQNELDSSTYQESRTKSLDRFQTSLSNIEKLEGLDPNEDFHFIIIDDIMFLKSMRKEIYKICVSFGLSSSFQLVYFNCPLDLSLQRNLNRLKTASSYNVPEESIKKIYNNFSIPNQKHYFEKNFYEINSIEIITRSILLLKFEYLFQLAKNKSSKIFIPSIENIKDKNDIEIEIFMPKNRSKLVDEILRKSINNLLTNLVKLNLNIINNISNYFITKKKSILLNIKINYNNFYNNIYSILYHIKQEIILILKNSINFNSNQQQDEFEDILDQWFDYSLQLFNELIRVE